MKDYLKLQAKEIPLYRGNLVVVFSNSEKEIQKVIPKYESEDPYAHTYYSAYKGRQGFYIILNFDSEHRKITHGVITHEVVHCAEMIADFRGFIADFANNEPIAYLAEWISDEVYKAIKKHGYEAS